MRRFIPILLALLALPLAASGDGPEVQAGHVWIREAPPGTDVVGGYLILNNLTDKPLTLVKVTSPNFESVEIHQTVVKSGIESMLPVDKLVIPASQSVEFKPGGYHLMLMRPRKSLFSGDMVTLTLEFSDNSMLTVLAPVRRDPPNN